MTTHGNPELDSVELADPTMQRVIADLQRTCTITMPSDSRAGIARQLLATPNPAALTRPRPRGRMARFGVRKLLVAMAVAIVVAVTGLAGYDRLDTPTPVSAAQILRRGATAVMDVPAGDVVHEITQIDVTGSSGPMPNDDVRFEQWTQVGPTGGPLQFDLQSRSPNPALDERMVGEAGGTWWTYGSKPDVVTKSTWRPGTSPFAAIPPASSAGTIDYLPKEMLYAPQDPKVMHDLLTAAASGADGNVRLLLRQTIDGQPMDVIAITHTVKTPGQGSSGTTTDFYTIYLDASTHLVRRINVDGMGTHYPGQFDQTFDVTTYQVVPLSDVPAGIFSFTPAPGTKVCTPWQPEGPGGSMNCTTIG